MRTGGLWLQNFRIGQKNQMQTEIGASFEVGALFYDQTAKRINTVHRE